MCKFVSAVTLVIVLAGGVSGRTVLQDNGSVDPTSFAVKQNTNSKGLVSAETAIQQAVQNQKSTQLQSRQTQIKPQGTSKKTLQQVGDICTC